MEFVDQYDADFNYIGQQEITYNKTNIAFSPSIVAAAGIELKPLKSLALNSPKSMLENNIWITPLRKINH